MKIKAWRKIITLVFYNIILALLAGIFIKNPAICIILIIGAVIISLLGNLIHTVFIYLFSRILGGDGAFLTTFNLICYSSVLDILLILGLLFLSVGKYVIIPLIGLYMIWKMTVKIIAVSKQQHIGYGKAFLSSYGILFILMIIIMGLI